ncbi:methyl-accepting chemotaxis protein [Rhizomicrobium palustre]|uniref:Methyl-accepting chemotaxis protein n=1 Tax=Rhizomicrobium palustre TaxID=189966 RepID=A0A846N1E2_9PROT|nr:methyl-accepting chemotaxis protein [Rhizomicrobium palustre]NIK89285.1 methyl-accepting chemotaxis protein [Rhizomicrobium palustre]
MPRIQDVSVGTKVIIAMFCIALVAFGSGIFSAVKLASVNANAADIRDNWLPSTRSLGELQYWATRNRAGQAVLLLAATDAQREKQAKRNAAFEKKIGEIIDDEMKHARNDVERGYIQAISSAWAEYMPMKDRVDEIQKTQGHDASVAFFMTTSRDSFDKLNKAMEAAVAYNTDSGVAAGNASEATYKSSRNWIFVSVALVLLFCAATGFAMVRSVSAPLARMTHSMSELAAGNMQVEVPHAEQKDEIGELAGAMTSFKNQLNAAEEFKAEQTRIIVSSVGTALSHLAKGDLTHRITAELTGPFAKLKEDFNISVGHLQDTVTTILENTGDIASGATEISQAADDLSRRTEQQAASLEETAAALESVTETLKKTAANTREADKSSSLATQVAKEGGEVLDAATTAMDAIAQSSKEITDIIGVIDEIAFQTNLLALNAGVEAARAGEAGKGFAVVASEVRALAGRSSEAAKKIKTLIHASGDHVAGGVKLVGESAAALKRIMEQVHGINALVSEVATAASHQATSIQEVNAAVGQMDQVTQQNAAMVEESTAASRSLADKTRALQELVLFFDVGSAAAVRRDTPRPKAQSVAPRPPAAPRRIAAAGSSKPAAPAASGDDGWAEF